MVNLKNIKPMFDHGVGAAILIFTAGGLFFAVLPILVSAEAQAFNFSTSQLALLVSIYMAGYFFTSLIALLWIRMVPWHHILILSAAVSLISGAMIGLSDIYWQLLTAHFLAGLVTGACGAIANQVFGKSPNPGRSFSIAFTIAFLIQALIAYFIASLVVQHMGLRGVAFIFAAVVAIFLCAAYRFLPKISLPSESNVNELKAALKPSLPIIFCLLGILLFQAGWTSIWSFAKIIADQQGISNDLSGLLLSLGLVMIALGAFIASLIGARFGQKLPVIFSSAVVITAMLLIASAHNNIFYAIGIITFCLGWGGGVPFQLSVLAKIDSQARFLVLIGLSQGLGSTIGPLGAGAVSQSYSLNSIGLYGGSLVLVATCLIIGCSRFMDNVKTNH